MMTQANAKKKDVDFQSAANIRRQLRTELNTRFLRNLPMFKSDRGTPDDWNDLLAGIDEAESRKQSN